MENKKIVDAKIISNTKLADGIYKLEILAPPVCHTAKPGQFVNVYTKDNARLLPRPISICLAQGDVLTLVFGVVGMGTREFSALTPNDIIRISTPLGNGYNLDGAKNGDRAVLVGGGIGLPPMCMLAQHLVQLGMEVTVVAGFKDQPLLCDELENINAKVFVATDSGSQGFKGNVVELIKSENIKGDCWFSCGPKVMLKFLSRHVLAQGQDMQVSMEERMGCGFGACVGCVCDVKDSGGVIIRKKVCKDGPVFLASEVVWDE